MRYIGGKSLLLDEIGKVIKEIAPKSKCVIDLFSGSGVVSNYFKQCGYNVICNDQMYFSYVLLRGITQLNKTPTFDSLKIKKPIEYLNDLTFDDAGFDIGECFIYQNYAPHNPCQRMYFTVENALKIDIIRLTIEKWKDNNEINDDEYFYLLASLISAVPFVANITGVYAAYLKHWDPRALKPLKLVEPEIITSNCTTSSYNVTCNRLLETVEADVLYSDSPYNTREYLPNYHILETIAKYDNPEIKGVTGMRDYKSQKSDFCVKAKVHNAFETMIRTANVKYIVISYNNEGLISTEELSEICKKYAVDGTFHLKEIPYRRYKSKIPNEQNGLCEQIYYFEKKKNFYNKSPMNYIGGKYKLLPQIEKLFPKDINKMVDLFCGGCDVVANVVAKEVVANDINDYVIGILKEFQNMNIDELLFEIDKIIEKYKLSKTNKDGYLELRNHYNKSFEKNPLELYVLVCYSFNYQFRFNSDHEYNNPFGKDRSCFSPAMRENLIKFHKAIKNVRFTTQNFKSVNISKLGKSDFIYADPPYLITTGSYNDGKRGFEGWSKEDDQELFELLDKAHKQGVRFAMSNVLEHKGITNEELKKWASKYKIHYLNFNYNNSNYRSKNTDEKTVEVLITNY
jgi:adenine-specific DNA-methyltransferase